jgi:hypothetical protein
MTPFSKRSPQCHPQLTGSFRSKGFDPINASQTPFQKADRSDCRELSPFGNVSSIITDEQLTILAGHGRYQAAQSIGMKEIEVRVLSGLTEGQKRAYMLADNKIAENAGWDRALLAGELSSLAVALPTDLSIGDLGFTEVQREALLADLVRRLRFQHSSRR